MAGHDYVDAYDMETLFGVKSAADRFAIAVNRQLWSTKEGYPSFYIVK